MKVIITDEKYNFLKVMDSNVKQFTYVDKFNKPMYIHYKLFNGQVLDIDVRRKKEKKNLNIPLIYNMFEVATSKQSKVKKTIVLVENEETADFINKRSKTLVATTILNGIDNDNLTEKMLNLFKGLDVIIVSHSDNAHTYLKSTISCFANSVKELNVNTQNTELLSKEEKRLVKMLRH